MTSETVIAAGYAGTLLVVALTGWGQEEDRRRARMAGFDQHLTKPAEVEDLQRLLSAQGAHDAGQDRAPGSALDCLPIASRRRER